MKYVDEFRMPEALRALVAAINARASRNWQIMEVCGGQTHAILKHGIDAALEGSVTLLHGPGCPVCVTPAACIDEAIALARRPEVILCTFGDMLRVPGTRTTLASAKAQGGDVRIVYSPLDALAIARAEPEREIVFFAVGFETTAPTTAMLAHEAAREDLGNLSLLVSHVLVPPALIALMEDEAAHIDAFLAAGHVCTVMGLRDYEPIAARYQVPIVATGFEPADILQGILMCVEQLESGEARLENQYDRVVRPDGNAHARRIVEEVFEPAAQEWRGMGELPASGLRLRAPYAAFDARTRFALGAPAASADTGCRAGDVLRGRIEPTACPHFGTDCTPATPLGAPMVSSEGACAAYHRYHALKRVSA